MKSYFNLLILLLSLASTHAVSEENPIQINMSASYSSDDNIARAANYDKISDNILGFNAAATYQIPINLSSFFALKGALAINQYQDYDKLSNTQPSLEASYHIRPLSGYTATRYALAATYTQRLFDSEQREGSAINIALSASKRLTDLVTVRAGISQEDISAEEKTFEASNRRLYLDMDYKFIKNHTLYLTLGSFDGDIASSNTIDYAPPSHAYNYSVQDDAFLSLTPTRDAYRINVKALSYTLGNSYAINSKQAIDISISGYDASAYGGVSYKGSIYKLSYLHRF